jgi:alcohol dehydrogenase class IV
VSDPIASTCGPIAPGDNPALATAERIVFGAGRLAEIGTLARRFGARALVVTGAAQRHAGRLGRLLDDAGLTSEVFAFAGEPGVVTVLKGLEAARRFNADLVIGLGGGSAIDAAKAIAGFLGNPGDPLDYLEVVGRGRALAEPAAPWIAIPTTAGTGAEVTRNAVLTVPERESKVSLRSPFLFARVALVDPELSAGAPVALAAATGLDALTQLLEPYVCNRANPATDALCAAGLPRAARALEQLAEQPNHPAGRTDLALASLWSGQALTNAGLGAVHGLAAPIGGLFAAPHGAVCAVLLAPVMHANLAALRRLDPNSPVLARYTKIGRWLTGAPSAEADDGALWVQSLVTRLRVPSLSHFGVTPGHFAEIAQRGQLASSMKANPIALSEVELIGVLRAAS